MPLKHVFNIFFLIVSLTLIVTLTTQQTAAQCNPYFKNSARKAIDALISVSTIADFNGDGKPDIAGLDSSNGNFLVLLNDGAGNFSDPVTTFVGISYEYLASDLNGDGKTDLLVKLNNMTNPAVVATFTGNGDGSFTPWNVTSTNQLNSMIHMPNYKFDNDPRPQILTTIFNNTSDVFYYIPINSNGTLAPAVPLNISLLGPGVFGDFNGDGKTDLVAQAPNNGSNMILYTNTGNATFTQRLFSSDLIYPRRAADLNNDGKDDVIAVDQTGTRLIIFLSSQVGKFARFNAAPTLNYNNLMVNDYNGDGFKDIIRYDYAQNTDYSYTIYYGSTLGTFTQNTINKPLYGSNQSADFDGDGKADFIGSDYPTYFSQTSIFIKKNVCTPPGQPSIVDFDGDGTTDLAVWRPSDGRWSFRGLYLYTPTEVIWGLGSLGDTPVPGDYDGDGKTDLAVWRNSNGVWYIRRSSDLTAQYLQWGLGGDKPEPGDYDGDTVTDSAVYRPSTGTWYVRRSSDGQLSAVQFGVATDKPTPADYDGDGKTDVAVYRPSTGTWYILKSSNGEFYTVQFGIAEDKPTPADYDGDGRADLAVYRPSTSFWYLTSSFTGGSVAFPWGSSGDFLTPMSLPSEPAQVLVYRPSIGRWYVANNDNFYNFGGADEIQVSSLLRIE